MGLLRALKRRGSVTTVLVVALVAAGCDSGDVGTVLGDETAAGARVATARMVDSVARARAAGSVRFDSELRIEVDGRVVLRSRSRGAIDGRERRGVVLTELAGATTGAVTEVREAIVVGGVAYLRQPVLDPGWVTVDGGASADSAAEAVWSAATGSPAFDVAVGLDVLSAVEPPVREVGRTRVRGVPATRYRCDIRLVDLVPGGSLAGALVASSSGRRGDGPVRLDAWLDGQGLARRVVVRASDVLAGRSRAPEVDVVLETEAYDHGRDVEVDAPPVLGTVGLGEALTGWVTGPGAR